MQNRTIKKGDTLALLVEDSGPGGMYTELGRSCVLGKVPQQMKDELEMVKESRKLTLDMLKPGTPCKDIWEAFNAFMRKNGRPEEARLYCHGQGYDLVERPLIRSDEPWTIQKDMNIVVHPTYALRRLSQLAVRQLHHRRQRPRRPHPPVPGRDRRDRRLGRASTPSFRDAREVAGPESTAWTCRSRASCIPRLACAARAPRNDASSVQRPMNLLIFLTHPEPTRSGYEKYLAPRHPELTINTVGTRDEALKLAPEADILMASARR